MIEPNTRLTGSASEYGSDVDDSLITSMSDYGSDIGFEDVEGALDMFEEAPPVNATTVLPSIEFEQGELEDEEQDVDGFVQIHRPAVLRVAKSKTHAELDRQWDIQSSPARGDKALEVEYSARSRRAWSGMSSRP